MEEEDYVEVHGKRILKPFVEKPVDGIHIFPESLWVVLLLAIMLAWADLSVCFFSASSF